MSQPLPSSSTSNLQQTAAQLALCASQISDAQGQIIARQKALIKLTNRIRQSLDWTTICNTTTTDLRSLLSADRVAIYRFNEDWSGEFVFESAGSQWISLVEAQQTNSLIAKNVNDCSVRLLDTHKTDTHLQASAGGAFVQGEVFRTCSDIHNAGFSDCYIEVLGSYQARAYAIIAIYIENKLWGLLAAYQNDGPRDWQEEDVNLLLQVAEQLGVALNQAEYVQTIQRQSVQLARSLSDLKQSQAQLVQSEKMASLGQLVAGVAHEINNPVNFIYANLSHVESYSADLLSLASLCQQSDLSSSTEVATLQAQAADMDLEFILEDLPKILSSMEIGAERIRQIVLSLRNFSRLGECNTKAVDIHEGIDSTLLILGHRLKVNSDRPKIEVIKNYSDLPPVQCYPAQLNQVFMNLLANAVDALEEAVLEGSTQTPKIWISTQLNEAGQAEIRIRDNGVGIDESRKTQIFDHFFTTKPVGQGTGLGLAISRQIVMENHGGTLSLGTSQQGTEFVISLPI
ncbi:MAG: histidine kinase [Leptolyngbya foveolarum]|uniref:histidine kinase n=1 Tax=Leptolyngbya foveolarum TaxID=47253 RepID=A0A2W4TRZ6_9CYAN|nr:MAG: histidine kinase [Leptolyngbya foveolarum]